MEYAPMRIQIDDNSSALTPFGSLVSGAVRSKTAGKPRAIAFQADRSHRQTTQLATLLTIAIITIIFIGVATNLGLTLFDHR